jgi:PAS domain S-box-containing protein
VNRSRYPLGVYLGLLLVVILAVGVLVGLYASGQARNAVSAAAATTSARTAQGSAQQIDSVFQSRVSELQAMAGTPYAAALLAAPPAGCKLSYGAISNGDHGHLDLLNAQGRVVCTSSPSAGESYAGAPWFKPGANSVEVSGLYDDPRAGWSLVVAAPVSRSGVLAEFVSTAPLAQLASATYSAAQPYEFVLTTSDGRQVVSRSTDPDRYVGRSLASTAFFQERFDATRPGLDGVSRIWGEAPIPGPGWLLFTGISESTALSGVNSAELREFAIVLGGFVLAVLATLLVYRRITRPLRQLSEAVTATDATLDGASADADADADVDVDVAGPREVAVLGEAIRTLRDSVHRELTERTRAEAEARASERAYRTLFDESPLPMWVFQPDRLLGVNEAAIELYGFDRDEIPYMQVDSVWVDDIPEEVRAAFEEGAPLEQSGPWRHRKRDGSVVEVMVSCRNIVFGAIEARLLITEDVTDRERMQRQIVQTERLESLGQLAGGVAHDFNNLLGVIMSYLAFVREWALAQSDGDDSASHTVLSDLDQIDLATNRAAELTRQLLAFGRREKVSARPIRVKTVIEEVRRLLSRSLGERIELLTLVRDDAATVVVDPGQMEQVFINLAVNARDAMPTGGTVTIEASSVRLAEPEATELWGLDPGDYVRISVRDTGRGMTPDVALHAFEPFFTTKPAGKGTGLGLSSIYGIVVGAGGAIRLESEPEEGTDVVMLFPAAAEEDETGPAGTVRVELSGAGRTALVVEDEAGLREVIRRMLERHGYAVLVAADGPSAIELSRAHAGTIDVLLTDVVMPRMQGTELADVICAERRDTLVVYMTGYAREAFADSDTHPTAVIEKPFREEDLLAVLRQHERPA